MAISLKHAFQSAKADSGDASLVRPSNWNAEHTITLDTARLIGRYTAGNGAAQEVTLGTGFSFSGAALTLNVATALGYTPVNKVGDTITGNLMIGTGEGVFLNNGGVIEVIRVAGAIIDMKNNSADDYDVRIIQSGGSLNIDCTAGGTLQQNGARVIVAGEGSAPIGITGSAAQLGGVAAANFLQTANLGQATADIGHNAIGSICMMRRVGAGSFNQGDTSIGSQLLYSNADASFTGSNPSGTWACQGRCTGGAAGAASVAVWKRVS
jgi:hypothetical protein